MIELSAKSDQFSEVSETGVQDSEESGTTPHPYPVIVPTDPAASTPLIDTMTDILKPIVPTSPAFHKFGERKISHEISDTQISQAKHKPVTKKVIDSGKPTSD